MYRVFIVLLYLRVVGCSEARRARGGAQCWTYSLVYLYKHFGEVNESGSPNLGTSRQAALAQVPSQAGGGAGAGSW